jgi:ketosteroid isomerase-like protein
MEAMSEAAIRAAVERYAAAWVKGDRLELFACYHDDFTLYYAGDNALSGVHRGKARALEVLAEFSKRVGKRRLVRIVATMAGTERGAIIAREALGPDETEMDRVLVYAVKDGLLSECWVYDADQPLINRLVGR